MKPPLSKFRGADYFNQLLHTGWLFELSNLPTHSTLSILNQIRNNCDALTDNQASQQPVVGAFSNRISLMDVFDTVSDPVWSFGFVILSVLFFFFTPVLFGFFSSVVVLFMLALFRAYRHANTTTQNQNTLTSLKEEESRLQAQIQADVQKLSNQPFIITQPHIKLLFQPIALSSEHQRHWDERMLRLAHQNTEPAFFDLSSEISTSNGY